MARSERQKAALQKLVGNRNGTVKTVIYKCWDCEIELMVPPHLEHRVKSGAVRCDNPDCPGQKKGGGKYVKK